MFVFINTATVYIVSLRNIFDLEKTGTAFKFILQTCGYRSTISRFRFRVYVSK